MNTRGRSRTGFFLVIVLIVVAVATMAVYSFTELMVAYDDAAYLSGDLVQARVNIESGTELIRVVLAQPEQSRVDTGGVYNNPQLFQAVTVSTGIDDDTPSNFSVIAPALTDTGTYGGIRFGLQNESARLNINTLPVLEAETDTLMPLIQAMAPDDDSFDSDNVAVSLLMALPGMTTDVAEAIMDWLDEDDEARDYGAESEYYNSLTPPYSTANGPLQSVEDLLLVRGVTPTLLFGADVNRNGVIDPDEQTRFGISVETPGAFGWSGYLTVHGAEANKSREGVLRVYVNQDDIELLYDQLQQVLPEESYASYIAAYRIAGQPAPTSTGVASEGESEEESNQGEQQAGQIAPWNSDALSNFDLSGGGGTSLTQLLDLIDSTVTVGDGDAAITYTSPFASDPVSMSIYMPVLMDLLTTRQSQVMPGRLNLNQCPAELLYGIPFLSEQTVQSIIEAREPESDEDYKYFETWPLVEGIVTIDEMRLLTLLLTGGGDVYRAQIVGYFEKSGIAQRAEVIVDATTPNPKIVSWRDMSHLGRGFDLSVLGIRNAADWTP